MLSHKIFVAACVVGNFVLSAGATYLLFEVLHSTGVFKKGGWSLGGALVGFLVIFFGVFHYVPKFSAEMKNDEIKVLAEKVARLKAECITTWEVEGYVATQGQDKSGVSVRQEPSSFVLTDPSGHFLLRDVKVKSDEWPRIQIESDDFFPITQRLSESNAVKEASSTLFNMKGEIELTAK
jgi:hypothetical protein